MSEIRTEIRTCAYCGDPIIRLAGDHNRGWFHDPDCHSFSITKAHIPGPAPLNGGSHDL